MISFGCSNKTKYATRVIGCLKGLCSVRSYALSFRFYFKVIQAAGNEHHLVPEFVAVASYLSFGDAPYLYLPDGMREDYPLRPVWERVLFSSIAIISYPNATQVWHYLISIKPKL